MAYITVSVPFNCSVKNEIGLTLCYVLVRPFKLSQYRLLAYLDGERTTLEIPSYQLVPSNLVLNMEVHAGCIKYDLAN